MCSKGTDRAARPDRQGWWALCSVCSSHLWGADFHAEITWYLHSTRSLQVRTFDQVKCDIFFFQIFKLKAANCSPQAKFLVWLAISVFHSNMNSLANTWKTKDGNSKERVHYKKSRFLRKFPRPKEYFASSKQTVFSGCNDKWLMIHVYQKDSQETDPPSPSQVFREWTQTRTSGNRMALMSSMAATVKRKSIPGIVHNISPLGKQSASTKGRSLWVRNQNRWDTNLVSSHNNWAQC